MSRTTATENAYLREGFRHLRSAQVAAQSSPDPIEAFCRWLEAQTDVLLSTTVRLYRQEVAAAIRWLGVDRDPAMLAAYIDRCDVALRARIGKPPAPRTATRKVVDTTDDEARTVLRCLARCAAGRPNDNLVPLTGLYVYLAARLGCRPIEWLHARIEGDVLIFRNAKDTNGRSGFSERRIGLRSFSPLMQEALRLFVDYLPVAAARYPSYAHCRNAMAETLARACAISGVRRLSLYSFRHVAIATWRRAGVADWAVAALAGHASAVTARKHYASADVGWEPGQGMAEPDPVRVRELESMAGGTRADPHVLAVASTDPEVEASDGSPSGTDGWDHDLGESAIPKPDQPKHVPDPAGAAAFRAYAKTIDVAIEELKAVTGRRSDGEPDREAEDRSGLKGGP